MTGSEDIQLLNEFFVNYDIYIIFLDLGITEEKYYPSEGKLSNEREKEGKKLEASHFKKHKGKIPCVKADGKRCKTAIGNGKYKVKDHVTTIVEPSGEYLSKFIPENGSGKVIASHVFFLLTFFQAIGKKRALEIIFNILAQP